MTIRYTVLRIPPQQTEEYRAKFGHKFWLVERGGNGGNRKRTQRNRKAMSHSTNNILRGLDFYEQR
jgi:hypothetical protein